MTMTAVMTSEGDRAGPARRVSRARIHRSSGQMATPSPPRSAPTVPSALTQAPTGRCVGLSAPCPGVVDNVAMQLTGRQRAALLAALAGYSAFLGWVLLWPSAAPATTVVRFVQGLALRTHLVEPGLLPEARVEFILNVAMVVPLALLAVWWWPAWSWERWTAYGFLVSVSFELLQGLLLPDRTTQFVDVVANTSGVFLGAWGGGRLARARQRRAEETSDGSRGRDPPLRE